MQKGLSGFEFMNRPHLGLVGSDLLWWSIAERLGGVKQACHSTRSAALDFTEIDARSSFATPVLDFACRLASQADCTGWELVIR